MMTKRPYAIIVTIALVAIIFWTFKYFKPVEKIEITGRMKELSIKYLNTLSVNSKFPFCEIVPVKDYDAVLVVPPYSTTSSFDKFEIKNSGFWMHKAMNFHDGKFALIYMKDDHAVGYSIVNRAPVDFCSTGRGVYKIEKSDCSVVFAHRDQYGYRLFINAGKEYYEPADSAAY